MPLHSDVYGRSPSPRAVRRMLDGITSGPPTHYGFRVSSERTRQDAAISNAAISQVAASMGRRAIVAAAPVMPSAGLPTPEFISPRWCNGCTHDATEHLCGPWCA